MPRPSVSIVLLLLFCSALHGQDDAKLPYSISRKTTRITEPLKADGRVDFLTACNTAFSRNVTRENNAAIDLLPVLSWDSDNRNRILAEMKIPDSINVKFVALEDFVGPQEWNVALIRELNFECSKPWSAIDHPRIAQWLDSNKKVMDRARIAIAKPYFYVPLFAVDENNDLPEEKDALVARRKKGPNRYSDQLNELSRAFVIKSMCELKLGNVDESWADLIAARDLAKHIAAGQSPIFGDVGMGCHSRVCDAVLNFLQVAIDSKKLDWTTNLAQWGKNPNVADLRRQIDLTARFDVLQSICCIADGRETPSTIADLSDQFDETVDLRKIVFYLRSQQRLDWEEGMRWLNTFYDRLIELVELDGQDSGDKKLDEVGLNINRIHNELGESIQFIAAVTTANSPSEKAKIISQRILLQNSTVQTLVHWEFHERDKSKTIQLILAALSFRQLNGQLPMKIGELDHLIGKQNVKTESKTGKPIQFFHRNGRLVIRNTGLYDRRYHISTTERVDADTDDWGIEIPN